MGCLSSLGMFFLLGCWRWAQDRDHSYATDRVSVKIINFISFMINIGLNLKTIKGQEYISS